MNGLTELQIIVDSGLFILIWLAQLIIYPSFRYTNEEHFILRHGRYTFFMGLIVSPLMLIQAGFEGIVLCQDEVRCWRIVPIFLILPATFSLSALCHRQLQNHGKVLSTINRLVVTNWIRSLLWTLLFLRTGLAEYKLPLR